MPKVYNKHHKDAPKDAVYVGRPSKWGNPFVIGALVRVSGGPVDIAHYDRLTRDTAVLAYKRMVESEPKLLDAIRSELKGKDLVCWCAPAKCHADVLLHYANVPDHTGESTKGNT